MEGQNHFVIKILLWVLPIPSIEAGQEPRLAFKKIDLTFQCLIYMDIEIAVSA